MSNRQRFTQQQVIDARFSWCILGMGKVCLQSYTYYTGMRNLSQVAAVGRSHGQNAGATERGELVSRLCNGQAKA